MAKTLVVIRQLPGCDPVVHNVVLEPTPERIQQDGIDDIGNWMQYRAHLETDDFMEKFVEFKAAKWTFSFVQAV